MSDCQTHKWSRLGPGNGFICSFFHSDLVGGSENNRPVVSWKVPKLYSLTGFRNTMVCILQTENNHCLLLTKKEN